MVETLLDGNEHIPDSRGGMDAAGYRYGGMHERH